MNFHPTTRGSYQPQIGHRKNLEAHCGICQGKVHRHRFFPVVNEQEKMGILGGWDGVEEMEIGLEILIRGGKGREVEKIAGCGMGQGVGRGSAQLMTNTDKARGTEKGARTRKEHVVEKTVETDHPEKDTVAVDLMNIEDEMEADRGKKL